MIDVVKDSTQPHVPFGISVGDFVAVGGLIHQAITALSDSRGSKADYRELISLLSSLKNALDILGDQFDQLARAGEVDAAIKNGLKHQLGLCTKAIEDFLVSSRGYTESLLPDHLKKRFRDEWRKWTWTFREKDVHKLHLTLQGHIQAFIMFTDAISGVYLSQIKQLSLTSNRAIVRIEQQQTETLTSLMSMVMMRQPPRELGYTWEGDMAPNQAPVRFDDALGRTFYIPLEFCHTINTFHDALKILFQNSPGKEKVARREYEIAANSSIIQEADWQRKVLPGGYITMNILLRLHGASLGSTTEENYTCPKCKTLNYQIKPVRGFLHCLNCQLVFWVTRQERVIKIVDPQEEVEQEPARLILEVERSKSSHMEESLFRRIHYLNEFVYFEIPKNLVTSRIVQETMIRLKKIVQQNSQELAQQQLQKALSRYFSVEQQQIQSIERVLFEGQGLPKVLRLECIIYPQKTRITAEAPD